MANDTERNNTAIIAVIVIAAIIIGILIYYWGGRDRGTAINQTNIESPMQGPGPGTGTGAEHTQRSSPTRNP